MTTLLSVPRINLGSIDAVNYRSKEDKEFFAKILHRETFLHEVLEPKKYFLIGEKGTGKTSYAVFLNNSEYCDTLSRIVSLSETDYRRFLQLKAAGKFDISSFTDIWRVILLLLVSDGIKNRFGGGVLQSKKFQNLTGAIDEYYYSAFRPEVEQSLNFVENSELAAKILSKHLEVGGKAASEMEMNFPSFQVNLAYLQKIFQDALSSINLNKDFILFVDGLDIRPDQIDYSQYIECIRGLANAVWELNTEFFGNIKGSKGRIKVVLLIRPDIMDSVGFHNLNGKVHDNGVVLNWITTYENFKNSPIFKLVSGTLAKQQEHGQLTDYGVWKYYFPYEYENLRVAEKLDDPFVGILRYSFYRPRDIIRYLQLMQQYVEQHEADKNIFSRESFFACQRDFSDYLLGEVRDYLKFYHSTVDFEEVVGFFAQFGGKNKFSWDEFQNAFFSYREVLQSKTKEITIKELTSTPEEFLQFLYSLNMVGYLEPDGTGGHFVHWCFRDRTTAKLRPKVRYGLTYVVHPGLQRALLVGGENRGNSPRRKRRRRRRGKGS